MKKFILLLFVTAGVIFTSSGQDSSLADTTHQLRPQRPDPATPTSSQQRIPPNDAYRNTDPLIQIRMDAIPSALRKTLMGREYKGWENSVIFQNSRTSEFSVDIRSGDSLRTFRFDRFGNPLNPNTPQKDD